MWSLTRGWAFGDELQEVQELGVGVLLVVRRRPERPPEREAHLRRPDAGRDARAGGRADVMSRSVPTIQAATLGQLAAGHYIDDGEPVVLLGDSAPARAPAHRTRPRSLRTRSRSPLHHHRPTRQRTRRGRRRPIGEPACPTSGTAMATAIPSGPPACSSGRLRPPSSPADHVRVRDHRVCPIVERERAR